MGRIWFTSDTHFCHNKEFLYQPRGFDNIEDMNNTIVKNWNEVVSEDDDVYHLGDIMLNDNEKGIKYLKQLKGKIHIILGNHCTDTRIELYKELPNIVEIKYAKLIKIGKQYYYLSHYPTFTANYDDDKPYHSHIINLYGHTHQKDNFFTFMGSPLYAEPNPFMYHVGVDSHNCYPVSAEEVSKDIHNEVNRQYKIKVQQAIEEKEYYENGLEYFERHPLGKGVEN